MISFGGQEKYTWKQACMEQTTLAIKEGPICLYIMKLDTWIANFHLAPCIYLATNICLVRYLSCLQSDLLCLWSDLF